MAIIDHESRFDLDSIEASIVGIAADVGQHDSGMHKHEKAQLLYAPRGCMSITLYEAESSQRQCVLPPTKAAWIPAGVEHCVKMRNVVAYRSIYFDIEVFSELPRTVKLLGVNPLLRALIERMAMWAWDMPTGQQAALIALFIEELNLAEELKLSLPIPTDKRLQTWLERLASGQHQAEQLNLMASDIGASEKTISRIFNKQTGMSYQAWRQQWRLQAAIEQLAEGRRVSAVAFALGFASDSAFISFFKQHLGNTPSQYFKAGY
ncbi:MULTISPECIES: helix-turn-helix domain-containing protein [unclassified Shewanella]|uniref:AraC family transcriptional regulator n=1 Tax=unclassified Shewanella TaxID=196818 RepID=UPI001BC3F5FD|nr:MULTISPECIES: helix-turn-helix transcriptional regulator [unclassified Shewanella]GIU19792.1 AraC family transcriptional regulator [Shewanella sp. MBTL60-112-B1]GIU27842.1 AraC family transcriptional regulator [Shewanella sp. MBTL60-112-B2]